MLFNATQSWFAAMLSDVSIKLHMSAFNVLWGCCPAMHTSCAVSHVQVRFVPGRLDTNTADVGDLLPNFQDDYFHTLMYFLNNGKG